MTPEIQQTLATLNSPRNLANGGAQWGFDEAKGAYFNVNPRTGQKRYENTAMPGSTTAQSQVKGGGLIHSRGQWDQGKGQWVTPINWGKVGSLVVGGVMGGGALSAAGAFGGTGAGTAATTGGQLGMNGAMASAATGLGTGTGVAGGAAAGGGMGLGKILGSPLLGKGIEAGFGLYGARQQQKGVNSQLALEQQRDQQAQRQWEAQQAFQQQQFAAQEDERGFNRQEAERRIGLEQAREARQAPYRAASTAALGRLGNLLGLRL